ncbi:peptidase M23 [Merismopedia glauca]|uniref:Peptidase M23 n=1 Tax=Merismopedia glauca CCAP 1448/3 TaxID=1296344 RepID=A0A2T1BZD5_9CYAN|nr:peptidase M23 [Merismopedia glauca]PSB01361.1 peptidase M23 [Merismopedia glauca CCAP 1448/3]
MKKILFYSCLGLLLAQSSAMAAIATRQVGLSGVDNQGKPVQELLTLPDFTKITWASFPPITQDGEFTDNGYNNAAGYNLTRSWKSGDTPDRILKLGDISEAFGAEKFNLKDIFQISNLKRDEVALDSFPLIKEQSLFHLAQVVPKLGDLPLSTMPPIAALVQKFSSAPINPNISLNNLLSKSPQLGDLKMGGVDLTDFSLSGIPNLEFTPLEQFYLWENSLIKDIPGLNAVPFSAFPIPLSPDGNQVARIDFIWGEKEGGKKKTISGSDLEGFNVPCRTKCAHVELDDLENTGIKQTAPFEGVQWISGQFQQVKGGHGALAAVNGGLEPTGRHPYGKGFKVVVWNVKEKEELVDTALFFRFCGKFVGCSPYILGPFPFLAYKRDAPMFVGTATVPQSPVTGPTPSISNPTLGISTPLPNTALVTGDLGNFSGNNPTNVGEIVSGVNLSQMIEAISQVESSSDYRLVGAYVCAGSDCGRALGRYQFMPYRQDVKDTIMASTGGDAFLQKALKGEAITAKEMDEFFPTYLQDELMRKSMKALIQQTASQIDPTTNTYFTGSSLIARVAQKHFGGANVAVDSSANDGGISVFNYGLKVLEIYQG